MPAGERPPPKLQEILRNPGFWVIVAAVVGLGVFHLREDLTHPLFVRELGSGLHLSRHSFERVLFLIPMVYAGVLLRARGWVLVSLLVLLAMIPRAAVFSPHPRDAIFEVFAVMMVNVMLFLLIESLRREKEHLNELKTAHQKLKASEERYRGLFENAIDPILIQDLDGNILEANKACEKVFSRGKEALSGVNVKSLLAEEGFTIAKEIKWKLLHGESIDQPYEQVIERKDGSRGVLKVATSTIMTAGKPVGFQHIARDVTEEKRMQENLRFYVRGVTMAQEEERKRIARELHDDTAQALLALSRQLDNLISRKDGVPEAMVAFLDNLRGRIDSTLEGVRRFSRDLRPSVLDDLGLLAALEWLTADLTRNFGIASEVRVHGQARRLPAEVEVVLFRIVQEALRNVWKHARARMAVVDLGFQPESISLTVKDDGKGFERPGMIGDLVATGKLGLAGMQERISLLGGHMEIESGVGKGTSISLTIPLQ